MLPYPTQFLVSIAIPLIPYGTCFQNIEPSLIVVGCVPIPMLVSMIFYVLIPKWVACSFILNYVIADVEIENYWDVLLVVSIIIPL